MPLPFTVVCEPPPFLARTWRIWVLVGGLAVTASAFLFFFFGLPAGPGPEVGGATLTYTWAAFPRQPVLPADPAVDLLGNTLFAVGAVALLLIAARRRITSGTG